MTESKGPRVFRPISTDDDSDVFDVRPTETKMSGDDTYPKVDLYAAGLVSESQPEKLSPLSTSPSSETESGTPPAPPQNSPDSPPESQEEPASAVKVAKFPKR